jgi:hypothetical protein
MLKYVLQASRSVGSIGALKSVVTGGAEDR